MYASLAMADEEGFKEGEDYQIGSQGPEIFVTDNLVKSRKFKKIVKRFRGEFR